jgi:uncharacterized transporter YbjL
LAFEYRRRRRVLLTNTRHLILGGRCRQVSSEARQAEITEQYSMTWRLYYGLAVLMIVFVFAHIVALQIVNARHSKLPVTVDAPAE